MGAVGAAPGGPELRRKELEFPLFLNEGEESAQDSAFGATEEAEAPRPRGYRPPPTFLQLEKGWRTSGVPAWWWRRGATGVFQALLLAMDWDRGGSPCPLEGAVGIQGDPGRQKVKTENKEEEQQQLHSTGDKKPNRQPGKFIYNGRVLDCDARFAF